MSGTHALWSPSGAAKHALCLASLAAERGIPDTDSEYSIEGTRAHELAGFLFRREVITDQEDFLDAGSPPDDMLEHVGAYVNRCVSLAKTMNIPRADMLIEQWVDCREMVRECSGTSDVILVGDEELVSIDLKYGMGEWVGADFELTLDGVTFEGNWQTALYLLGAWFRFQFTHSFKTFRAIIDQPRLGALTEFVYTLPQLLAFAEMARKAADESLGIYHRTGVAGIHPDSVNFNPGVKQCRWCKALPFCKAAKAKIDAAMRSEFTAIADDVTVLVDTPNLVPGKDVVADHGSILGQAMGEVEFVEHWCKAVRAETFNALRAGVIVPGQKLVQGKQGNRNWNDEAAAAELLAKARLKMTERYEMTLISPTTAEKLLKKTKPRHWKRAQALIFRKPGGLSVAPESDPRPAFSMTSEFEAIPADDTAPPGPAEGRCPVCGEYAEDMALCCADPLPPAPAETYIDDGSQFV